MDIKYVSMSDFEKVCRICMKFDKTFLSINSFKIIDMIVACASVQIWENDDLPNQICDGCFLQLQNTMNFKQLCENSDIAFRQIVEQNKNKLWSNQYDLNNVKNEELSTLNYPVYIKEENEEENVTNQNKDDAKKSTQNNVEEMVQIKNEDKTELNKIKTRKKITQYKFEEDSDGYENINDENDLDYDSKNEKPESGKQQQHIKEYKCETCSNSFKTASALGSHMKKAHNAEGIKCEKCSVIVYHPLHLRVHEKRHNRCRICSSLFSTHKELIQHKLTHKKSVKCEGCQEIFQTKIAFEKHARKMHPKMKIPRRRDKYEKQDVSCDLCGKIVRRRNLRLHMLSHREHDNLTCRYCEKIFTSPEALNDHMQVSHKKCICDHCGLRLRSNQLKTHLLTHTKERPHACDKCDKTYGQKWQLKQHVSRIHLNERNFVCTFCSQAFFDKKTLLNHVRRHTGEKPFKCQMCEKRFIQKVALNVHMKVHTNAI